MSEQGRWGPLVKSIPKENKQDFKKNQKRQKILYYSMLKKQQKNHTDR